MSENRHGDGNKCKYKHPKLCKYFITSGSKCCIKGASCTFLHPILCNFSVEQRLCTIIIFKFAYLKGSAREGTKEPFHSSQNMRCGKILTLRMYPAMFFFTTETNGVKSEHLRRR